MSEVEGEVRAQVHEEGRRVDRMAADRHRVVRVQSRRTEPGKRLRHGLARASKFGDHLRARRAAMAELVFAIAHIRRPAKHAADKILQVATHVQRQRTHGVGDTRRDLPQHLIIWTGLHLADKAFEFANDLHLHKILENHGHIVGVQGSRGPEVGGGRGF